MYKKASRFAQNVRPSRCVPRGDISNTSNLGIPVSLIDAFHSRDLVTGKFLRREQDGFVFLVNHYFPSFCPEKEMYPPDIGESELATLIFEFEIIKIDISQESVIISRKKALERKAWTQIRKAFIDKTFISGKVKNLQKYGVFIDLGGVDGLLHKSQIQNTNLRNLDELFKPGEMVNVTILGIDEIRKRVTLSMRQR